jgi:hypothetical protein
MGWASGDEIFDPVAQALIDLGADATTKRRVLGTLIDKLQDNDWDTESESLERFWVDPVIVQAFYEHGVGNRISNGPQGTIGYDAKTNEWTLTCDGGQDSCGGIGRSDGSTAAGHDELVVAWAQHEKEWHGGGGIVATDMLIGEAT